MDSQPIEKDKKRRVSSTQKMGAMLEPDLTINMSHGKGPETNAGSMITPITKRQIRRTRQSSMHPEKKKKK